MGLKAGVLPERADLLDSPKADRMECSPRSKPNFGATDLSDPPAGFHYTLIPVCHHFVPVDSYSPYAITTPHPMMIHFQKQDQSLRPDAWLHQQIEGGNLFLVPQDPVQQALADYLSQISSYPSDFRLYLCVQHLYHICLKSLDPSLNPFQFPLFQTAMSQQEQRFLSWGEDLVDAYVADFPPPVLEDGEALPLPTHFNSTVLRKLRRMLRNEMDYRTGLMVCLLHTCLWTLPYLRRKSPLEQDNLAEDVFLAVFPMIQYKFGYALCIESYQTVSRLVYFKKQLRIVDVWADQRGFSSHPRWDDLYQTKPLKYLLLDCL